MQFIQNSPFSAAPWIWWEARPKIFVKYFVEAKPKMFLFSIDTWQSYELPVISNSSQPLYPHILTCGPHTQTQSLQSLHWSWHGRPVTGYYDTIIIWYFQQYYVVLLVLQKSKKLPRCGIFSIQINLSFGSKEPDFWHFCHPCSAIFGTNCLINRI